MDEVEKLYKLARVQKNFVYYKCLKGTTTSFLDCPIDSSEKDKECQYCWYNKMEEIYKYPPFTAEKQIELIKWLSKLKDFEFESVFLRGIYIVGFRECMSNNKYLAENKKFELAIAELICDIWKDLTPEEHAEIRRILE